MAATSTIGRLADALARAGAHAVLLSRADDVCYATGFDVPPPIDAGAAFAAAPPLALVTAGGDALLLCPAAYGARAAETSFAEVRLVDGFGHFERVDAAHELAVALEDALRDAGIGGSQRLAVDRSSLPAAVAGLLRAALVDARPIAREARLVKTERELELLRAAAAAADAGQEALLSGARAGRNELEVMSDVLAHASRAAGEWVAWAGELVTGPRSARVAPEGPIDRELVTGDTFILDLSLRVRGYWADCCNTGVVEREPSAEQLRFARAARAAHDAAVFELWPGRRASDAHDAAARVLAEHGFAPAHYTGHQVGASVNEEPRLVPYDHTQLEPGMVFAVEPGVYAGEGGTTGARAEKVVLVGETGPQYLSQFRWAIDG